MLKILERLINEGKLSKEVAEAIDSEVSKIIKEARDEAASWRVKYKEINEAYKEVAGSKEKFEKELEALNEKIEKAKLEGKKEVLKELEKEKEEKAKLISNLKQLEMTATELRIDNALKSELAKYDVLDAELTAIALKQQLEVVDGEVKFKDGKSLEDGVKEFFEKRPHLLKPKGNSGSGAGVSNTGFDTNSLTAKILQHR